MGNQCAVVLFDVNLKTVYQVEIYPRCVDFADNGVLFFFYSQIYRVSQK